MEITTSSRTDAKVPVTVLHLKGDLDMKTHQDLENQVRQAHSEGVKYVLLDLTNLRYLTSAGLRAIHSAFNLLREGDSAESDPVVQKGMRGGAFKSAHLKLVNPSKSVREVLTIAGYDMFMEIHPDVDTAIRSF
jgi:anti-sigma B factor antagonist